MGRKKDLEVALYEKRQRENKNKTSHLIEPKEALQDTDEVAYQFKCMYDLYEVLGERGLNVLYTQLKETSWKAEEIEIFRQRGLSQSCWYNPGFIEDRCRRKGVHYDKISKEIM